MSEYRGEGRRDSVALTRFLLSAAAASGIDARRLAREAELPSWALTAGMGTLDVRHVTRLWELIEHAVDGSDAALTVARQYRMGALDLYDYLFATAPALGEGLARSLRYMYLVTTNSTLRLSDLALPMRTADPVLAEILVRYAESVPLPPVTWLDQFREVVTGVMEDGAPCGVDEVARRMSVSVRTLQRRLAEWGTTWSAQLDEIRCRRVREADLLANPSMQSLAARLGYSDVRSVRRAMRRWKDVAGIDSHH